MAKIDKEFKLPKPKLVGDEYEFLPVVRVGRVIPFGYTQDPNDKDILLPVEVELELLEKAKEFLKRYSYREVANWLTEQSGRKITHAGLRTRVNSEQKRSREASNYRYLAECYKEAARKAKEIEERTLGRKRSRDSGTDSTD